MSRALALPLALTLLCAGCPGETAAPPPAQPQVAPEAPKTGATAQPTAPVKATFDKASAKTPWKYAQVGDWATYASYAGNETVNMKFEVTGVTDTSVTFTMTYVGKGQPRSVTLDLAEEEGRYKDPFTYDALLGQPETKTIDFKGRQLEVLVVKRGKEGMSSTEMWLAEKDVRPFNQCAVKSFRDGKLQLELLDFGSK